MGVANINEKVAAQVRQVVASLHFRQFEPGGSVAVHLRHVIPSAEYLPARHSSHIPVDALGIIPILHVSHLVGSAVHLLQLAMHFLHSLTKVG